MDLGFVGHAVERDKERFRSPAQASGTLQFTHCSAFLRRGFVDLDYADAGFFQVRRFCVEGHGHFVAGNRAWLVVTYKKTVQYGGRAV